MKVILYISLFIVFYTYVGYGIVLFLLVKLRRLIKGNRPDITIDNDLLPTCTVIVAAYNEQEVINDKILNTLALNYPKDKIEYIFIADGSTDQTVSLISKYDEISLLFQQERSGKIAAVHRAMQQVKTAIVVFTDANTFLNKNALLEICRHYMDIDVGAVAGEKRVEIDEHSDATAGEGFYWKYESKLKKWDSELYSVVGAAGELFSVRTDLYQPVPIDSILDDFMISMLIAKKGFRIVYEPKAYATESSSASVGEELKRKIRISAGGIQSIIWLKALLLNPLSLPVLSFQYISHRVLRWTITPFLLITAFLSNVFLTISNGGLFFTGLLVLQILFYMLALSGWIMESSQTRVKVLFIPYYFCMMNYAVIAGICRYFNSGQSVIWEKAERRKSKNILSTSNHVLILFIALFLILSGFNAYPQIKKGKGYPHINNGNITFSDMLGVNAFEWNFLQDPKNPNDGTHIFEPKMELIKSFGGVRHYLDWSKIEAAKGSYTYNPTTNGGWNLDAIYERCKTDGLDVLVCFKTCPDWLLKSYPENERDPENVPAPYGLNRGLPKSYIDQAKAAFQFAARYGYNKNVNPALISVNSTPRWTGDQINKLKIGMGLIRYIECDNERDKWWKGDKAKQTAAEYAANLSAFYDGDKGRLGKNVGVKNADPKMQVVMAGLASADVKYVQGMINWCKAHRGYKTDGSVNLCWDVINYHLYASDHLLNPNNKKTVGIAPELSETAAIADSFVKLGKAYKLPVWVTEAGYDVNAKSPQRAIRIGTKEIPITQADWLLRTSLLYARHGIDKLFFYVLYDDDIKNPTQYASSGLIADNLVRRPAANYIYQIKKLMGNYHYIQTISNNPLVDIYEYDGKKIYVLTVPDEKGRSAFYDLPVKANAIATEYNLNPDGITMFNHKLQSSNNKLHIKASETPVFIKVGD